MESETQRRFADAAKSEKSWKKFLKKSGIASDQPGADYRKIEPLRAGVISLTPPQEWYLMQMFEAARRIFPTLFKRPWRAVISPSGSFVAADNPVILEGPKGAMRGFQNAELITYVVSRHLFLYSASDRLTVRETRKNIARMNTLSLLHCDQQVFSHIPDFDWMDADQKMQRDWKLFVKEKYL